MTESIQDPLILPERVTRHVIETRRPNGSIKQREIWEPDDELRHRHEEALRKFRALKIPMPHAFGGVRGKTIYDNIAAHQLNNYFYLLDLKDAYASVDIERLRKIVYEAVKERAISKELPKELDSFVESDAVLDGVPGLPLGLPASPFLCNLYFSGMDAMLYKVLSKRSPEDHPVTVTRWIDDIAISSFYFDWLKRKERARIRSIIEHHGGEVNHGKSKFHELSKGPVTIAGMSLYPDRRIAPSPRLMDQVTRKLAQAADKLASGELTWADMDELNGHKSILHLTKAGSPNASGQESVRRLARRYDDFSRRAISILGERL